MKMAILACSVVCALSGALSAADQNAATERELLAMERRAMDGWQVGNPDPAIEISDPEITYFHAVTDKRIDGLPALKALYETYRGRSLFESYEIAEPKMQLSGETAVLTYIFVWHAKGATTRWNATHVYQRKKAGWRVIHSHWSTTKAL